MLTHLMALNSLRELIDHAAVDYDYGTRDLRKDIETPKLRQGNPGLEGQ